MQHAHMVDRPVKITNFHENIDEFNEKSVLTLGNQPKVEYATKLILFETVKGNVEKMNHTTSLQEVATKISIGETVNVMVYIDLKEAEPVKINIQYGIKKKQEVIEYDNSYSDHIKLTLWNAHIDHIDSIAKSGVYKLQSVNVNSFNGKYLTTTAATVIKESEAEIEIKEVQTTTTFDNVSFPPETLNLFEPSHFCKKCKRKTQPIGVFVVCSNCSSKSLVKNSESKFLIKATFTKENDAKVMLTMPHEVLVKSCDMLGILIDNDEEIHIQLLTTCNVKATYSTKTCH